MSVSRFILLGLFCFSCKFATAQRDVDTTGIKKALSQIMERDQYIRKSDDSAAYRSMIDSSNLAYVEMLIRNYGWPGKSFVGASGNYTVWLIIQHADLSTQQKYLPLLEASVQQGESREVDLVYLQDRILMREGKNQLYGTQVWTNSKSGAQEFWPIEDAKHVNERREKYGLEKIEDYAKRFGMEYKIPEE